MKSIRARLLVFLLLSALFTACVVGWLTYSNTLREHEQLFDYQLRQMAMSLRDQGAVPAPVPWAGAESPDFAVQIWTIDGRTLYLSRPGIVLGDQARLGFSDILVEGHRWRAYSAAARDRVIQVAQPFEVRRDLAAAAAFRSLLPLLVFVPLMAVLIWGLVGRSLAPLNRLAAEVRQRDAGSLAPVSDSHLPSEIAPVAGALNALLLRLQRSFDRERAFVADAAHELRSPLTALKLQLQMYRRAPDDAAREAAVTQLTEGVDRATHLVEQLLTLARSDPDGAALPNDRVDLGETVRLAAADAFPAAEVRGTRLELDAPAPVFVAGQAGALRILARNLFDNAIRYTPPGGSVRGRVGAEGEVALIVVEDSGPGIPPQDRERVFDRFFRRGDAAAGADSSDAATEAAAENPAAPFVEGGSGLGLAIVKSITQRHRGEVRLDASALGGLRVTVRLPRAAETGVPDSVQ